MATPENETALLDLALAGTAAHVERFVRAWRWLDRVEQARQDETRHLNRQLSTWLDGDGMVVIRGRLTPEVGAVVQRALEAAADRLFRDAAGASTGGVMAEDVTPAQRRADALGLLAECALAADLDRGTAGDRYQVVLHVNAEGTTADTAPTASAGAGPVALTRSSSAGPRVFDGAIEVDHGAQYVSAETSRRLSCDAAVVRMDHDTSGAVLSVSRKTRTIPPAIRRALHARDTSCRFPGCTSRRCDAHHVQHWADGGSTSVDNLVLLCRRHHRAVHEGGFSVVPQPDGSMTFWRPDGQRLETALPLPRWHRGSDIHDGAVPAVVHHSPLNPVTAQSAVGDLTIGAHSLPVWDGTPFDLAWAIGAVRRPASS